ncbi:MAG: pyridoxal 5'-phosphate synthase glutaminase subunit PdxT [Candidatus Marinimicrobia bacterium]|nr:pyridoxal 5'-phosphate synthase glutaminase subunit PdxT [Candidatus Neomarinimicrobiota bacterium]MDD5582171.1 pyridoxal 5'-phosphate synthase glutaminase subunit PdxT [Candidatus Neomarinimicrobiota bacterium]
MTQIGVLAIQGAFCKHLDILHSLHVKAIPVKYAKDLESLDGLIIPGGESTVITRQLGFRLSWEDIYHFAQEKAVFGTCAGLILMGKGCSDPRVRQLGLMNAIIERNAYGSQIESFTEDVTLSFDTYPFHAVFIRAPKILKIGKDVEIIASFQGEAVMIQQGHLLGAAFHPELTNDTRVHEYFMHHCVN